MTQFGVITRVPPSNDKGNLALASGVTFLVSETVDMAVYTPLQLHGFGVKSAGLRVYGDLLASSDSMAWSFTARHDPPLPGCTHKACNNCLRYALRWRANVMRNLETVQLRLA